MLEPVFTVLPYSHHKPDTPVSVLNFDDLPDWKNRVKDQQLIQFSPSGIAGNHTHPRTEWFIATGEGLRLYWFDEHKILKFREMYEEGHILVVEIPPHLPHSVKNHSDKTVMMLEFADAKMEDKKFIQVIG